MSSTPQPPPFQNQPQLPPSVPVINTHAHPKPRITSGPFAKSSPQFLDYAAMFSGIVGLPVLLMPCFWIFSIPLFLGGLIVALSSAFSAKGGINGIQIVAIALNFGALLAMATFMVWVWVSAHM